jgi:purine-binding chemotaxis protein CheW
MKDVPTQFVVFRLGDQRYALSLAAVERVIFAVEVTVLPNAPSIVLGVINVAGNIIPVLNLRRRFGLIEREIGPADQFLIVQKVRQTVALVIDEALEVIERPEHDIMGAAPIVPGVDQIQGLIKLADGLVLLHDLEKILSLDETQVLAAALNQEVTHER